MTDGKITSFVWTIDYFDMFPHLTGETLYSPEFRIGSYRFCLHLYPRGYLDSKYISVFFNRLEDCGAPEIWVDLKIYPIGDIQVSEYNNNSFRKNFKNISNGGYPYFIKRDTFLAAKGMPNNRLAIKCDILSLSEDDETSGMKNNTLKDDHDAESLSRDHEALLSSGIYSDMVLIINEIKFKVHKCILNFRCPKLISQLQETEIPDEYTLNDIEEPLLQILLQYLYTGTFNVANMHEEMLIASDTYKIPHLANLLTFPYCKVITATTEIVVYDLSFRWVIKKFSKLKVNEELVYPVFYSTCDEWSKIKVILTITQSENRSNRIQLKFRKLASSMVYFIRCKISIFRLNHTTVNEYEHIFTSGEDWITPFGSEIDLSQILFRDALDTFFEISMSKNEINSKIKSVLIETRREEVGKTGIIKNLKLLQKDLGSLYDNKSISGDITLRVGDANYTVHKFIMCARSPVFAKMFENDTSERKEGIVAIEDIDAQTVSAMLRYIYTGYIDDIDISEAINLYIAADKYEILTLRDKCSNILKVSMDSDHIGNILLLADAHYDDDLRSCVYDYMTSNPGKLLESKDGLSALKNRLDVYPDILNAFLKHASSNASKKTDSY